MNHKRGRPKARRAGCLLCKPNKLGQGLEKKIGRQSFGKMRSADATNRDLRDAPLVH